MIHIGRSDHGTAIMKSTGADFTDVTMQVISRSENNELYGGVVYENWTGEGGSCLVHIAGFKKNWINRDMLFIMFDYPFRQLDCVQAFCQVKSTLTNVLEFNKSFGWEEVITLEGVYPDADMILMRMKRDGCRYLDVKPRTIRSNKVINHG